uniref:Uncharacterized protein n=1 Tax=Oryza punctata TaxID=4537 RepID=A0A0E0M6P8_ORYPU
MEWWSFELLVLLSGLLPNPKLETSVLSICLNTGSLMFMVPYGLCTSIYIYMVSKRKNRPLREAIENNTWLRDLNL